MMFWIVIAALTAVVTFAVTRPMMRATAARSGECGAEAVDHHRADLAVYKDQLIEIDADAARGVIGAEEADAARAEVARRVLRHSDTGTQPAMSAKTSLLLQPVYVITSIALPLISLSLYLNFGAPGLPGAPLAERLAAPVQNNQTNQTGDLIAKVEARLRDHPDDGKGWDVIAPVYLASGRPVDAAQAYASAMKYLGESPQRLQGFANARIRAENGIVPEDARKALQTLLAGNPKLKEPRVWLGLAKEQDGKLDEAAADYRALIAEAPEGAPWKAPLQERLDKLSGAARPSAAAGAVSAVGQGPDAASVEAVQSMKPEDRQAFIERMVGGLAERLKSNASDKDGWLKLIRSYQMMGRKDDAVKALAGAKAGLNGNAAALGEIDALAKQLGIGS